MRTPKLALLAVVFAAGAANAAAVLAPPQSRAFGQPLSGWLHDYFVSYFAGGPAEGRTGVVFLAFPTDCENGACWRQVQVAPGTPLYVPVATWIRELYVDGSIDPAWTPDYFFDQVIMDAAIDGRRIDDLHSRYAEAAFDPPIYYPEPSPYGSIAAIYVQGVGLLIDPLPPGTHTIHILNHWIYFSVTMDFTWSVTVSP